MARLDEWQRRVQDPFDVGPLPEALRAYRNVLLRRRWLPATWAVCSLLVLVDQTLGWPAGRQTAYGSVLITLPVLCIAAIAAMTIVEYRRAAG